MRPHTNPRGFRYFDPIEGYRGGQVRTYESSNAMSPNIWLQATDGIDGSKATVELDLAAAADLRDELNWLIANHYQGGQ